MDRFETRWLTAGKNLSAPADLPGQRSCSSPEASDFSQHGFESLSDARPAGDERLERPRRPHMLSSAVVFNPFSNLECCALRPGDVNGADGWENVLKPVVGRYRAKVSRIYFRADAGFVNPDVYEYLEAEGVKYAIRLPANRVLPEGIGYLLKRYPMTCPDPTPTSPIRQEAGPPPSGCRQG